VNMNLQGAAARHFNEVVTNPGLQHPLSVNFFRRAFAPMPSGVLVRPDKSVAPSSTESAIALFERMRSEASLPRRISRARGKR